MEAWRSCPALLVAAVVSVLFTSLVAARNIHQPLGVPASHRALGLYRSPRDADLALRHRHLLQTDEFEKSSAHVASAPSYAVVAAQLTDAAYGCNTVTASIQLCGVASSLAAPSFQSCIAAALGMTSIQVPRVVVTNIITSVAHDCPPPTEPEPQNCHDLCEIACNCGSQVTLQLTLLTANSSEAMAGERAISGLTSGNCNTLSQAVQCTQVGSFSGISLHVAYHYMLLAITLHACLLCCAVLVLAQMHTKFMSHTMGI